MDTTNIFQFFWIFAQNFYYFSPKKSNFGPIQLDIIAYIVSKAFQLPLCKISCFYQKVNDWCNFPLAITYFMCFKLTLPHFLSVEHCPPPPPVYQDPTYTDYVLYIYIYISDIGGLLIHGGGGTMFYKIIPFLVD